MTDAAFNKWLVELWKQPETWEPPTPRAREVERKLLRLAWEAGRAFELALLAAQLGKGDD